jgi:hypothetical protein
MTNEDSKPASDTKDSKESTPNGQSLIGLYVFYYIILVFRQLRTIFDSFFGGNPEPRVKIGKPVRELDSLILTIPESLST